MIVVDTSPFFHGPMLATLDRTDELLLVCGLDVPTLKNVRLALQTLELLSFPAERIRLVLNRANSKVGHEAQRGRGARSDVKVRFEIPTDRVVPLAVNRGEPAVRVAMPAPTSRAPCASSGEEHRVRPDAAASGSAAARRWRKGVGMGLHDRLEQQPTGQRRAPTSRQTRPPASPRPPVTPRRRARSAGAVDPVRRAEDPRAPRLHREARHRALQHGLDDDLSDTCSTRSRAARARPDAAHAARSASGSAARSPTTSSATARSSRSSPTTPSPRSWSTARPASSSSATARSSGRDVAVRRRRAPAADHRQDRLAGRPAHRRVVADGRRPPPRRLPRQRDHPAARARRARR